MAGVGGKRPAGWALALPIAKRAKRAKRPDQAAWDAALIDHRADAEIGWVTFQACGRSPAAAATAATAAMGTRARRAAAAAADNCPAVRAQESGCKVADAAQAPVAGGGRAPARLGRRARAQRQSALVRRHVQCARGCMHRCFRGVLGGRACLRTRPQGPLLLRPPRFLPASAEAGGPPPPRADLRAGLPCCVLMMACGGTRLRSSSGTKSIAGRLRSVAGQGIRVSRGGSGAGTLWGRNTAAARVLRSAGSHRASARRGDYRGV